MKTILKKVKNRSGETIAETLVALLISSLALVILAGAISASSGIIRKSSNKLNAYYDASNAAIEGMAGASGVNLTFGSDITVQVKVGVNDTLSSNNPVVMFSYKKSSGD